MYYKTIINLTTLGIHSYDDYDIKKSHYRDPLYPYIISFFIKKTIKDTAELSKCHFEENSHKDICQESLKIIAEFNKWNYIFFVFSLILISRYFFKNYFAIISLLILINPLFKDQIILVFTELISMNLILIYSFFLNYFITKKNNSIFSSLLTGLVFALLMYVKSVYFYLIYIYVALSFVYLIFFILSKLYFLNNMQIHFNFKFLIVHCLIALSLIMPWQLRNVIEFGDYKISDRASGVLSLRAEVFDITKDEYIHGFKYWLPDSKLRDHLILDKEILSVKFDDSQENKLAWWNRHDKTYGFVLSRMSLDSINTNHLIEYESKKVFMENFVLNVPITFLFFYKSLFIEFKANIFYKLVTWFLPLIFLFFFFKLLFTKNFFFIFFFLPAISHIGIYSYFTYYETRYNLLIIPILWLSIFIGLNAKKNQKKRKNINIRK